MYITSDLFGNSNSHNHGDMDMSTCWQAVETSQQEAELGKRKRQMGEDGSILRNCVHLPSHNAASFEGNRSQYYSLYPTSSTYTTEKRPMKRIRRLGSKPMLGKSSSHLMDIEPDYPQISNIDILPNPITDLRSCHACKSAPKRKKDLENYLDCKRCDQRTCYICARECYGGCGKAVCKKCIVEVGQEGDPWCLDCYSRNLNS